jgi:hypothetical protein
VTVTEEFMEEVRTAMARGLSCRMFPYAMQGRRAVQTFEGCVIGTRS